MTTEHFIIELFCRVDDMMSNAHKHTQAHLYPSGVVTTALLFAFNSVENRALYRWLKRDYGHLFPKRLERTHLFRLFNSHRHWIAHFLAAPSLIGLIDTTALS